MTTEQVQEEQNTDATENNTQEQAENKHPGLEHLDETTRNEILSLRNEAKERRLKNKELSKQLDELSSAVNKTKEEKLIEVKGKSIEILNSGTLEKISNYG